MIGIDEVGRGAWAGPLLVVAACGTLDFAVADSKVLKKAARKQLLPLLQAACRFGEGWVTPAEIDQVGLAGAMRLGVKRALSSLKAQTDDEIIMDGSVNYCGPEFTKVQTVIRADALHPIVSAASIYAKVMRDDFMERLASKLPGYGFEAHVGYGTAKHLAALKQYGVSQMHRTSFKPVRELM